MTTIGSIGKIITYLLIMAALLTLSIGWSVLQWNECKDMGHSTLYCVGHILK